MFKKNDQTIEVKVIEGLQRPDGGSLKKKKNDTVQELPGIISKSKELDVLFAGLSPVIAKPKNQLAQYRPKKLF